MTWGRRAGTLAAKFLTPSRAPNVDLAPQRFHNVAGNEFPSSGPHNRSLVRAQAPFVYEPVCVARVNELKGIAGSVTSAGLGRLWGRLCGTWTQFLRGRTTHTWSGGGKLA